jgi:hypothetical protein
VEVKPADDENEDEEALDEDIDDNPHELDVSHKYLPRLTSEALLSLPDNADLPIAERH